MTSDDGTDSILRRGFRAMATQVELFLRPSSGADATAEFDAAEREIRRLERIFSRFIKASDVQQLNGAGSCTACPELLDVVSLAMELREVTGGRFDPTVYGQLARDASTGPWSRGMARIDRTQRRIDLAPGTRLDLGAIVKGWAADRIVRRLGRSGSCLVNIGGDIALATEPGDEPWPVGIGSAGRAFNLVTGGLATSSPTRRKWVKAGPGGTDSRHIIDPATGDPADVSVRSVTVAATSGAIADAWSTALVVSGPDRALKLADEQGIACAVELDDGTLLTSPAFGG